jgi:hypothetical protein
MYQAGPIGGGQGRLGGVLMGGPWARLRSREPNFVFGAIFLSPSPARTLLKAARSLAPLLRQNLA